MSLTLVHLRQEYWIPRGRVEVEYLLNESVVCMHHHGAPYSWPDMPSWPRKAGSVSDPFKYVCLDNLGPLQVKEGNTVQKIWICLFPCFSGSRYPSGNSERVISTGFSGLCTSVYCWKRQATAIISDNAPRFCLVKSGLDQQWRDVHQDKAVQVFFIWSNQMEIYYCIYCIGTVQKRFYKRLVGLVNGTLQKGIGW